MGLSKNGQEPPNFEKSLNVEMVGYLVLLVACILVYLFMVNW